MYKLIRRIISFFVKKVYGTERNSLYYLVNSVEEDNLFFNQNQFVDSRKGINVHLGICHKIKDTFIGDYTYISQGANINRTYIGKFCSIGPNFSCGWGIHPTNGISTSPMFYSTKKQNGMTLTQYDKIEESKDINIGNDVFIGMNVTILDGVTIGDGAVIGAGAVVSKNIPAYAIAVGNPIEIKKYRFSSEKIEKLLKLKWWEWDSERLKEVERNFFDIDKFLAEHISED